MISTTNNNTSNDTASLPRLGAAHFANDPEFAVANLEKRFAPLGYIDRKHAYRITEPAPEPKEILVDGNFTGEYEPLDSASADISFTMDGDGPVVLCEPPCFLGKCSEMRRMPLLPHVTLELDGQKLEILPQLPRAVEVNGPFCSTIADDVPAGEHILRVTAITKAPHYAMFSHLITFS